MSWEKIVEKQRKNNEDPKRRTHYTPFGDVIPVREGTQIGFTSEWNCSKNTGICEYNLAEDPACDSCLHCGEPFERF